MRMFLYGTKGIGKTTLVVEAQKSLLVDPEGGSDQLDVNARIDQPHVNTWAKLNAVTDDICTNPIYSEFTTVGFDTADWIEKLCWRHCIQRDKPKSKGDYDLEASIEAYGFGKGYEVAADEFRKWLARLERLRAVGKNVVIIGHSATKKVQNPVGEDYEQFRPSVHDKVAALISGWVDIMAFAMYQVIVTKASKFAKAKAQNAMMAGVRWLYTSPSPAWEAKSRYLLPERMQLDAGEFWAALARGMGEDAGKLRKRIEAILAELRDTKIVELAKETMTKFGDNANGLNRLLQKCTVKLQEQQEADAQDQAKREAEAELSGEALPKVQDEESDGPPDDVPLATFNE